jgi:hypothetical protein
MPFNSTVFASVPKRPMSVHYPALRILPQEVFSNTMRICYCGVRFFFLHVLKRDWYTLDLVRAQSEGRVPAVLSLEEVRAILGYVRTPHNPPSPPPSTPAACDCRKLSIWRSPTSTPLRRERNGKHEVRPKEG